MIRCTGMSRLPETYFIQGLYDLSCHVPGDRDVSISVKNYCVYFPVHRDVPVHPGSYKQALREIQRELWYNLYSTENANDVHAIKRQSIRSMSYFKKIEIATINLK